MKNDILTHLINGEKLSLTEINQILPCKIVLETRNDQKKDIDLLSGLTEREKEIAKKISEGLKNKEIAKSLGISYETVKTHRKNIFRKLNIDHVSQLIKLHTMRHEK